MVAPVASDIIALYPGRAGLPGATFAEFGASIGGGAVPVEDEGSVVVAAPTALNFIGLGVTVVDNADVADITIPVLPIQDETVEIVADPSAIDFAGAGVVVTDVAGVATVTIPEAHLPIEDEGSSIVADPSALNYVGAGVTATDVAGVATVTIPAASAGETVIETFKQVDTSRSSDTTPTDDPELDIPGMTQGRWFVECDIGTVQAAGSISGHKVRWRVSGLTIGSTNIWFTVINIVNQVLNRGAADPTTIISYTPNNVGSALIRYRMIIDVTVAVSGTLFLQWSQNVSNANASTFLRNSFVRATRLGDLT